MGEKHKDGMPPQRACLPVRRTAVEGGSTVGMWRMGFMELGGMWGGGVRESFKSEMTVALALENELEFTG